MALTEIERRVLKKLEEATTDEKITAAVMLLPDGEEDFSMSTESPAASPTAPAPPAAMTALTHADVLPTASLRLRASWGSGWVRAVRTHGDLGCTRIQVQRGGQESPPRCP
jgi:hypothetical protein